MAALTHKMPQEFAEESFVPLHADSLHDLAGPVNQVCTMLELFRKQRPKRPDSVAVAEDDGEVVLELIHAAATRLQRLVAALETYPRVVGSPAECRRCEGNALLAGALASVEAIARQPEAISKIQLNMIIAAALVEGVALFAVVVSAFF